MAKVNDMPWIDSDGDTGVYTGEVNESNIPHGLGKMNYDDGPRVKGRWEEGEMVIEEEEEKLTNENINNDNHRQQSGKTIPASEEEDVEELKKRQLQEFHERNQQFLKSQSQYHQQQQTQEDNHLAEVQQLHREVYGLREQVGELSRELRITQESHQLMKDQSSAEITSLQTELDRQNSRHEQIVASLRNRLVESEMARMKMQDQLSTRMEEDAQREEELKVRWNEMTKRVLEDKKWVDEQMNYWKESMEEHQRRLNVSKMRGGLDAELGGSGVGGAMPGSTEKKQNDVVSVKDRKTSQRKLWGELDSSESSDGSEEWRRLPSAVRR